ncbi:MAG: hypothetical protein WAV47_08675, partial [Blastocatellia bacterium]
AALWEKPESHPRQWVEVSNPTYTGRQPIRARVWRRIPNPTHGSGWKFQIQPTQGDSRRVWENFSDRLTLIL